MSFIAKAFRENLNLRTHREIPRAGFTPPLQGRPIPVQTKGPLSWALSSLQSHAAPLRNKKQESSPKPKAVTSPFFTPSQMPTNYAQWLKAPKRSLFFPSSLHTARMSRTLPLLPSPFGLDYTATFPSTSAARPATLLQNISQQGNTTVASRYALTNPSIQWPPSWNAASAADQARALYPIFGQREVPAQPIAPLQGLRGWLNEVKKGLPLFFSFTLQEQNHNPQTALSQRGALLGIPAISLSLNIEENDSLALTEEATESEFLQAATIFIQESISDAQSILLSASPLPLAKTLFANVAGKKISIHVRTESTSPSLSATRSREIAKMMSQSFSHDSPKKNVVVEYSGHDSFRRSSAQTGDVVHANTYFLRIHDALQSAYETLVNAPESARQYIYGVKDALTQSTLNWAGERWADFQIGVKAGYQESPPEQGTFHRWGYTAGQGVRALTDGIKEGLLETGRSAQPSSKTPATNLHALGQQLGEAVRKTGLNAVEQAQSKLQFLAAGFQNGLLHPSPSQTAQPSSQNPGLLSQLTNDPQALGQQLGEAARETGLNALEQAQSKLQFLAAGFQNGLLHPSPSQTAQPSSQNPGLLSQLKDDPQALGQQLGEAARKTGSNALAQATSTAQSVLAGFQQGLLETDPSTQGSSQNPGLLSQLKANPQGLGQQLGEAARETGLNALAQTPSLIKGAINSVLSAISPSTTGEPAQNSFAEGILSYLSSAIKQGIKSAAVSTCLTALTFGLEEAKKRDLSTQTKAQIDDILKAITEFRSNSGTNIDELKEKIISLMNAEGTNDRNILQLSLNSFFPIPLRNNDNPSSTSEILHDVIAGAVPRDETPSIDYEEQIPQHKLRLSENIATMSALQFTNKYLLKGKLTDRDISNILHRGDETSTQYERGIQRINTLGLSRIRTLIAKMCFYMTSGIVNVIMKSFINGAFTKIERAVGTRSHTSTEEKKNAIVQSTNDFLCVLKGRMKEVRDTNNKTAEPETMLDKELCKPEYNHGFTIKQIYNKTIDKAVYNVLPPLGWSKSFSSAISTLSSLKQAMISPITIPMGLVINVVEKIANVILRKIVAVVVKKSNVLEQVIDRSMSYVTRNNYTHSINKVIYEQLKEISNSLDEESSNESENANEATHSKKEKLAEMVRSLSDVLRLNKQIRHADNNPTILEQIQESLSKLCVDHTAEVLGLLIDKASSTMLREDLLRKREYTTLEALNSSLESNTTTSQEDMVKLENEIEELGLNVFNRAIKKVVHGSLAKIPLNIQQKLSGIIDRLKETTQTFADEIQEQINAANIRRASQLIGQYAQMLKEYKSSVEDNQDLASQADLFDQFYIKPFAEHVHNLHTAAQEANVQNLQERKDSLLQTLSELRKVEQVDVSPVGASRFVENLAVWGALRLGKELLSEAWSICRKPFVWKHGLMHRPLIAFIESKV